MDKELFNEITQRVQKKINVRLKKMISSIKSEYRFQKDFDLERHLIHATAQYTVINFNCKSRPSNKESRKEINGLLMTVKKYCRQLENLSSSINNHYEKLLKKKTLDEIRELKIREAHFQHLLSRCPQKRGPKPMATTKNIIRLLVSIFVEGTGTFAECIHKNWSLGTYEGQAYKFLLSIKAIMKQLGINLGSDMTIGIHAKAIIKDGSLETLKSIKRIDEFPTPYSKDAARWV